MNFTRSKHPSTILGLTLDGGRLEAVTLRRSNGSVDIVKSALAALTLDPLRNEPELVGREIRNLLNAAGIRERRCVVAVPLHWALTIHSPVPAIDAADVPNFLEIEAERGFPRSPDELHIQTSRYQTSDTQAFATQIGIPRDYIRRLENLLEAAQLEPLSFSLGITALAEATPPSPRGSITLLITENNLELLVRTSGGISTLRTLEGIFDAEGGDKRIQSDLIARELRITLGQLPPDVRTSLQSIHILGQGRFPQLLADDLRTRAASLNLQIEDPGSFPPTAHGIQLPSGVPVTPSLALATRFLSGAGMGQEFLPPKPTLWQQFAERYASRRLAGAGAAAAAAAAILLSLFLVQQYRLSTLRSEWNTLRPRVAELEDLQAQTRKFRSWQDQSLTSLRILRTTTEAFPEEGLVTAKTLEIRNLRNVSVTGITQDKVLLRTFAKLQAIPQIQDLKVDVIQGKSPMQFTFNYRWTEGGNP